MFGKWYTVHAGTVEMDPEELLPIYDEDGDIVEDISLESIVDPRIESLYFGGAILEIRGVLGTYKYLYESLGEAVYSYLNECCSKDVHAA